MSLRFMATTQHLVELLSKQSSKPDTKLTGDLVKYFVDVFGTAKNFSDRTSCLAPIGLGATIKDEEEDKSFTDRAASSPESRTSPVSGARLSPLGGVSPTHLPLNSSRLSPPHMTGGLTTGTSPPISPGSPTQSHHGTKQVFEEPSMEVVKYVMGKRGGCQIVWQGHRYTRDRTRNDQTYWACVLKRPPYRCKGRISTKRSFVTSCTAHNHTHQTSKSQTARLIHQLKQKVQDSCTEAEAPDIVLSCLQEFKFNESSLNEELPSFDTLVKMCKRIVKNRKKNEEDLSATMNENYAQKLLNKLPGTQLDFLLGVNKPVSMDFETGDKRSISSQPPSMSMSLSSFSQASSQIPMDTTDSLSLRHSLATSGLGLRSPLLPNSPHLSSTLPTNPLLNGLFPSSPSNFTMVPLSTFLPPSLSTRTPGSAFTSTSPISQPNVVTSSSMNLRISNPMTIGDPVPVDVTTLETKTDGIVPPHEVLLKKGVSSITEIRSYLDEVEQLYRARVSEMKIIEEDCKSSREDCKSKDDRIKSLQQEVSKLDVALKVAQEGLQKVRTTAEDKVERSLIKAFFTQYITAPDNRKPEVMRLMTSVLNYSEEELQALQRNNDKKWLSGLLTPTSLPDKDALSGQSFSELFVSFLETEANRGAIMGSRGSPTSLSSTLSSTARHRSPSTTTFSHQRTPSSASNTSVQSAPPVASTKDTAAAAAAAAADSTTAASSAVLHGALPATAPLVVPASLADLLSTKPPAR